jgi:DNA-binding NarL/FixJ family response regulator
MIVFVENRDESIGRKVQQNLVEGGWEQFAGDLMPLVNIKQQQSQAGLQIDFVVAENLTVLPDATSKLSRLTKNAIVAVSYGGQIAQVLEILRSGACDFLDLYDYFDSQMKCIIRRINSYAAESVKTVNQLDGLTPAQRRVAELLLGEASEQEIAEKLGVSYFTIHNHVKEIYRRCKVHSRVQLMCALRESSNIPCIALPQA